MSETSCHSVLRYLNPYPNCSRGAACGFLSSWTFPTQPEYCNFHVAGVPIFFSLGKESLGSDGDALYSGPYVDVLRKRSCAWGVVSIQESCNHSLFLMLAQVLYATCGYNSWIFSSFRFFGGNFLLFCYHFLLLSLNCLLNAKCTCCSISGLLAGILEYF